MKTPLCVFLKLRLKEERVKFLGGQQLIKSLGLLWMQKKKIIIFLLGIFCEWDLNTSCTQEQRWDEQAAQRRLPERPTILGYFSEYLFSTTHQEKRRHSTSHQQVENRSGHRSVLGTERQKDVTYCEWSITLLSTPLNRALPFLNLKGDIDCGFGF